MQYVNHELPDVQGVFKKGRRTRDQIANISWIIEKASEFQKNIYFCFIDYTKASDWVDHNKLWKILKDTGTPDHLISLLRSCMQDKMQQLEPDMQQWTGSKLGKEYIEAVCCHLAYLLLRRVHHVKCQAGWITSWKQDYWEKYQQPQICRWY